MKTKLLLLAVCLLLLFFLSEHVVIFSILTLVCSIAMFGKIESDRNLHEMHFYARSGHYGAVVRMLRAYGKLEVIVRSFIVTFAASILFAGTSQERLLIVRWIFLGSVVATLVLIVSMQRKFHLIGSRWAYTKGFVVAGIIFSLLLASLGSAAGFWDTVKAGLSVAKSALTRSFAFDSWAHGAETFNVILQLAPIVLRSMLGIFLPDFVANILSTVFSINTLYGLIVLPYSMLLALFFDKEFLSSGHSPKPDAPSGNLSSGL